MASTFFGLSIAGSGLLASNASLNTTANNISNADTEGYSRQTVNQQAADALRTFTTYGCSGAGVKTLAIERIRDAYYDTKYRQNETNYGEYSTKNYYVTMLENYFTDDGKTGFTTIFTGLKTSLQNVLKDAGSTTSKQSFISTCTKLVEYFNQEATNLKNLQKDVNDEIKVKVEEINSISQEIASLNKQINIVELTGTTANELRDQRDLLVDRLSTIVSVDVSESPIYDSNNPDRETGASRFVVKIAGGQTLVDGSDRQELECVARSGNRRVNQTDINGLYDVYWKSTGDEFSLSNPSMGGELAGLVALRDGNNGESFSGIVSGVNTSQKTVEVTVTAEWLTDINKSNLAEAGTVSIGNTLYTYSGWTYTKNVDTNGAETVTYTFNLANDAEISASKIDKTVTVGSSNSFKGIPYYMAQMSEWTRLFAESMNSILESGYTDSGDPGTILFSADYTDGTQGLFGTCKDLFTGNTAKDTSYSVSTGDDSYLRLDGSTLAIFSSLAESADLLATKSREHATDGESQYDNISNLLSMMTDASQMSYRGCDAGEFLTCILGDVTLSANSCKTFTENYQNMETTLGNQRMSISGVDSDEEALNLIKYQKSYELASKMISTFAEIYDRLILQTGV